MKNYNLIIGFGDYTEIHKTKRTLEDGKVFATYKEAELASIEHVEKMQAYQCPACGGINPNCQDCSGSGWV